MAENAAEARPSSAGCVGRQFDIKQLLFFRVLYAQATDEQKRRTLYILPRILLPDTAPQGLSGRNDR